MTAQTDNKGKRFAIVAILLVVIAGLATAAGLVMVNRSDDTASDNPQYVVMDVASTTPVFEPRDAAGNDPFFPLETQLLAYQEEVEEEIDEQVAQAQADAEPGETVVRPEFDVAALDAAVKTGLYGGTEENTCNPERLISFLYANPDIGEAWAKVQGIEFSQIADYIRSLEVRVLAEPVNVLNHGFDESSGAAYEIDTVLDAGTAVLVDENGDVRTRCYCGNPIRPKPPEHMPPRCLVFGSIVFTQPGGTDKREDAPGDVLLTGRQTTIGGGVWIEVKWGTADNQVGWTQLNNLRKHYCPEPTNDRFCPGPGATNVWHTPDMSSHVGQVTGKVRTHDDTLDIFAPINPVGGIGNETIVNDFMLIRFKEGAPSVQNSAWVKLADLNQDSTECNRIRQCVDTDGPVRERAGGGNLAPAGIQWVEFTGHFIGDPLVTYAEVRMQDGTGNYGWISNFYTPLPDADCEPPVYECIELAAMYDSSDPVTANAIGQLVDVEATIIGGVENGRVEIMIDAPTGPTGWVSATSFYGGHHDCDPHPACYSTSGPAWTEFATNGVSKPADATPRTISHKGALVLEGVIAYQWIEEGGTSYWIQLGDLDSELPEDCEPDTGEKCPTMEKSPVDEYTPSVRDRATLDSATQARGTQDIDDPKATRDVCCVDALFNSTNAADIAAESVPRWVIAIDSSDVGGVLWFETPGPRFFRDTDIVSPDECERPECPEPNETPGRDDLVDQRDEILDRLAGLTETFIVVGTDDDNGNPDDYPEDTPWDEPTSGECCVDRLFDEKNIGEFPLTSAVWVDVESGPFDFGPSWYKTTTDDWFPETAVVDPSNCEQVDCPTDTPETPNDPVKQRFPDNADESGVLVLNAVAGFGTFDSEWCCVSGDVYDDEAGDVKGNLPEPTLVLVIGNSGDWAEIVIDGPLGDGWVLDTQFLPKEDCRPDDGGGCPQSSVFDTIDFGATSVDVCCIEVTVNGVTTYAGVALTDETQPGEDGGLEYLTTDGEWIPEDAFVDAVFCEGIVECPLPGSIVNAADPLTCCIAFGEAGFDILTLTGDVRVGENGEPEYLATDGIWYQDFADAGSCGPTQTPCNGTVLASGLCCEEPNEVVNNQCVPPCTNGQQRNANGVCETPQAACPPDRVRNADGTCVVIPDPDCPVGQIWTAGVGCVTPPCDDTDEDGICNDQDNCEFNPNPEQADADRDGSGNECDPCTDADQDKFCEIPGDINNDNCWDLFNPGQSDADSDGVGDLCDNCPNTPNAEQTNTDGIGPGDECEEPPCPRQATGAPGADSDGDGVCDDVDNCVNTPNANQEDRDDRDGWGDACDNCPDTYQTSQDNTYGDERGDACEPPPCGQGDDDNDGVCNGEDNCSQDANPGQEDNDSDLVGNACDLCPNSYSYNLDFDGDGFGDECDFCPGPNGPVNAYDVSNPDQGFLYDTTGNGVKDSCFAPLL